MRFEFKQFPSNLTAISVILFIFGVLMIYSGNQRLAIQQFIFGLAGLFLFNVLKQIDYRIFKKISFQIYFLSILLLIIIFFLGTEVRGSTRWIDLGVFRFQPSELVKPFLIIVLANFISSKDMSKLKNYLISFFIMAIPILLVFKQPDLGNSLVLIAIWVSIIFISFTRVTYLLTSIGLILASLPIFYLFLEQYQKNRIISFFNPSFDPLGIGYSVIQSQIAVGSGQLLGRGFGRGTQSHLQFLPEFNTDFIFATLAEELGLAGSIIVIVLFSVLILYLVKVAMNTKNLFGAAIVIGVAATILIQVTINVGMNIGLLPVTGITLPLVSYGGSSLVSTFIMLGLVASVERFSRSPS